MSALRASCFSWFIDHDLTVGAISSRRFAPDYFDIRANSIPQILLVVFEFVLDQEFDKLVLETSLGMMFMLVANVSDDILFF